MSTYPFSSDIVLLSSLLLSFASLSEAPLPLLIDYHSIDSLNSYVRYPYHYVISCLRRCVSPLANTLLLFSLIIMIAHLLAYDLWALTLLWLHFSCPFFRFFQQYIYVGLIACRVLVWWCQLDSSTLYVMHFTSTILVTSKVSRYFPWIFRDIPKVLYSRFFLLSQYRSMSSWLPFRICRSIDFLQV